jgi:DNA-binding CsgD family transcriptional regulator
LNKSSSHRETMSQYFVQAPISITYSFNKDIEGLSKKRFSEFISFFTKANKMTPREKDIVNYVLHGYPNSIIADRLNLSIGTIKNHRHRLYFKLDITTERELFSMFLEYLLRSDFKLHDRLSY